VRAPLDLSKQKTPGFLIIHTNGIRVLFLGMRELSEREREREREVLSYEKQCENHTSFSFFFSIRHKIFLKSSFLWS
jgi:hypothetical protein